ncbi:LysR family transcriptional regulator [Roseibium sp.]|uniref:LysR family transcriptional regulator n=1 Tax=Roseibium sp. TaxID=1936156 RepID=UPI003BB1B5E3
MLIDHIETFLDLCETRNFNRTADRLGLTQSTVSARISALEKTLEARLFNRSRSGTELTTEGLRFEPHARAMRHGWAEARNATRFAGTRVVSIRIGIQHDLIDRRISDLIANFRAALPDTAFFFEADYSNQMCSDLISGAADLAILFSPRQHPDLHYETIGEIAYRMVTTETDQLVEVTPERYILANFSPAFAHAHAALHPGLAEAPLSIGQNAAIAGMLLSLGGTAYVLKQAADELVSEGKCRFVPDAPPISQTVYAAINMRNRHRNAFRRLIRILRDSFFPAPGRR